MNLNLDIYVEGQRLDLFKDENVNIKASLKDSMSPIRYLLQFQRLTLYLLVKQITRYSSTTTELT